MFSSNFMLILKKLAKIYWNTINLIFEEVCMLIIYLSLYIFKQIKILVFPALNCGYVGSYRINNAVSTTKSYLSEEKELFQCK